MESFLPLYRSWRHWSDRRVQLDLPLFPSYVFLRATVEQRRQAVMAPGFLSFVRTSEGPVSVAATELQAIRKALDSGLQFDPMPEAQLGAPVEVVRGPLRGCRGFLLRKDEQAIALLVTAIAGGVRLALPDASWIRVLAHRRKSPDHNTQQRREAFLFS